MQSRGGAQDSSQHCRFKEGLSHIISEGGLRVRTQEASIPIFKMTETLAPIPKYSFSFMVMFEHALTSRKTFLRPVMSVYLINMLKKTFKTWDEGSNVLLSGMLAERSLAAYLRPLI